MDSDFKILSLGEESKLDSKQLKKYYGDYREYVLERKLTNTTRGATNVAPKLKEFTNNISMSLTKMLCAKDVQYISDGQENIPEGTVLFAHTHQGLLDNFAWIPATPQHCIIFHSIKVRKFLILSQLNTGLVLVNKDDKNSRMNAKLDTINLLLNNHSISFFPESAYLLSPNKLHLPMNYGFLDIARKANVPVVPVVSEYNYNNNNYKVDKIHISFCNPIYVSIDDSLDDKLEEYQEIISTKRFELIEEKGLYSRDSLSNQDYIDYLKSNIDVLKMAKIDLDVERKNLWNSGSEYYLFHHINDIPFDEDGNLLEPMEVRRLKKIDNKRKIKERIKLVNSFDVY